MDNLGSGGNSISSFTGYGLNTATSVRQSYIHQQIEENEKGLHELNERLGSLAVRLQSVALPEPPQAPNASGGQSPPQPSVSPLAHALGLQRNLIQTALAQVNRMHDLLDL